MKHLLFVAKDFFGFGGYQRQAEGAWSWQHLTFVSSLMVLMIGLSVFLGIFNRHRSLKHKNIVLIVSAIMIDAFEILKIVVALVKADNPGTKWQQLLPLFLCSIQLITIPLAAFAKGRIKQSAMDFVFIFGILGAVAGTFGAVQNYANYPVISIDNVVSGITHSISGFASLYIVISGMASMKLKNLPISFGILGGFCVAAIGANIAFDYNYMFLMRDDGTPYVIFYNLVGGNPVLYPMIVIFLFIVYMSLFWLVFNLIKTKGFKDLSHWKT